MTWFKENKFLAGLITITALLAAVIIYIGMGAGSSLKEAQTKVEAKKASIQKKKSLNPAPTPENAKAKEESLKAVIAKANETRAKLLAFRPESLEDVPGNDFTSNLTASVARVKALYTETKAIPSGFNLGFKQYAGKLPKQEATGILTYQLGAMEYLLTQLSESGGKKVVNLYREELPPEKGELWPNDPKYRPAFKRPSKPKIGAVRPPAFPRDKLPGIAHQMPIELTFRAPEPVVREFFTRLANSDQYFFETRFARVVNPAPIPSAGKQASNDKPASDFGDGPIVIEGADEPAEDEKPAAAVKILEKISGGEELIIHFRADLLLFLEEKTLPELK